MGFYRRCSKRFFVDFNLVMILDVGDFNEEKFLVSKFFKGIMLAANY